LSPRIKFLGLATWPYPFTDNSNERDDPLQEVVEVALHTIKTDLVRYEMRMVQGQDPNVREAKKPGAFGRFLSGFGKVLGSMAMPLSFLFPPAAIGAAGMYGVGAIGDGMQNRAYANAAEKAQRDQTTQVSFPGLQFGGMSQIQPAAGTMASNDQQIMQVLEARGGSMTEMTHRI